VYYSKNPSGYRNADNWLLQVFDYNNNLVDVPQSDIESIQVQKVLNGGSGEATITFRRPFNNVGAIGYVFSFRLWIWPGGTTMPVDPYWTGIQEDPDQVELSASGQSVVHAYGDFTMLNDAIVSLQFNPGVDGNPSLDCATLLTTLLQPNQPPGWLAPVIPGTMFPLLANQYTHEGLGDVLNDLLSQGRDSTGVLYTWHVKVNAAGQRQVVIQKDQNPNVITSVQFRHLFANSDFDTYKITTKYRDLVNVVAVYGAKDPTTGQQAYGVFEDATSQMDFHRIKEAAITVQSLLTNEACQAYGEVWLDLNAYPSAEGSCRLLRCDPTIDVGTWVQFWEAPAGAVSPTSIKQVRITQIDLQITKPNRIEQSLTTTSPVPYLDKAIYRIGNEIKTQQQISNKGLNVSRQRLYIRSGGILNGTSDSPAKVALTACQAVFPNGNYDGKTVKLAALALTKLQDNSGGPNNGVTGDGNFTVSATSSGTWVITFGDEPANNKTQQNVLGAYVVGGVPFCTDLRILSGLPGFSDQLPSLALKSGSVVLVGIPANEGSGAVDVPIDFYLDPSAWTTANHRLSYFEIGVVPHGSSQPITMYTKVVPTDDAHISCSVPGLGAGGTYDFYVTAFDNLDMPTQALFLCTDTASPVAIGVGNVNVAANLPAPTISNNGALQNVPAPPGQPGHPTQADIGCTVDITNAPTDGSASGVYFVWREHGQTAWNPSGELDLLGLPGTIEAHLSESGGSHVGDTSFNVDSVVGLFLGQVITWADVDDKLTIHTIGSGSFTTTTAATKAHANGTAIEAVGPPAVQALGYVYGSMANGKYFDFAFGYSSLGGYGALTQIGTPTQIANGFKSKALVVSGPYLDNGSLVTPSISGTTVAHLNESGGSHLADTTFTVDSVAELSVGQEITFADVDDPLVILSISSGSSSFTTTGGAAHAHANGTGILAATVYNGISVNGISAEVTLQFDITNQPIDGTLSLIRIWYRRHGGSHNWADAGAQDADGLGNNTILTTLTGSGPYAIGTHTFTVASVVGLAVGEYVQLGTEFLQITGVGGSSFTAAAGSTQAHNPGDTVYGPTNGSYVFGLADLLNGDFYDFAVSMQSTAGRESGKTVLVSNFQALALNLPTSGLPTIPTGTTVAATGAITGYSAVDGGTYHAAFSVTPVITPPTSDPRLFASWGAGFMILAKVNDTGTMDGDTNQTHYFKAGYIPDNNWVSGAIVGYTNGLSAGHAFQLAIAPVDQASNMGPLAVFALTVAQYIGGGTIRDGPNKIKNATFDVHAPFNHFGKCLQAANWTTYGTGGAGPGGPSDYAVCFFEGNNGKSCVFAILSDAFGSGVGGQNHNIQCMSAPIYLAPDQEFCLSAYIDASHATAGTKPGCGPPSIALITHKFGSWDFAKNDPSSSSYAPQTASILVEIGQNYGESGTVETTYANGSSAQTVSLLFQSHGSKVNGAGDGLEVFSLPMLQQGDHRGPFNYGDKKQGPRFDNDPINSDYPIDSQGGIAAGTGGGSEDHMGMSWQTQARIGADKTLAVDGTTGPVSGTLPYLNHDSSVRTALDANGNLKLNEFAGTTGIVVTPQGSLAGFPSAGALSDTTYALPTGTTMRFKCHFVLGGTGNDFLCGICSSGNLNAIGNRGYGMRWNHTTGDISIVRWTAGVETDLYLVTNMAMDTNVHALKVAVVTGATCTIEVSFDGAVLLKTDASVPMTSGRFGVAILDGSGGNAQFWRIQMDTQAPQYTELPAQVQAMMLTAPDASSSFFAPDVVHAQQIEGITGTGPVGLAKITSDVAIASPADGQILKYSGASSKWVNAAASGGGTVSSATESTQATIASPTVPAHILASNASRVGVTIWNKSASVMFIGKDATTSPTNAFDVAQPGERWDMPFAYTGDVYLIWDRVDPTAGAQANIVAYPS
jgi:hypothetical protein